MNKSEWNTRITVDPAVQHGKPIINGTRVPVSRLVGGLASGMSMDEVAEAYAVTHEDIRAALAFANQLVESEEFHPLPA
jgi:uncharacterized protein (DUF433 family)